MGRSKVVVLANISPERVSVVRSRLSPLGIEVAVVGFDRETGEVDVREVVRLARDAAAAYLEVPNFFGVIELGPPRWQTPLIR